MKVYMNKFMVLSIVFLFPWFGIAQDLNKLPKDLQVLILTHVDLPHILRFCQASKEKQKLCEDNKNIFYEIFAKRDFPNELKPENMSWEDFYFQKKVLRELPKKKKPENYSWKKYYMLINDLYKELGW